MQVISTYALTADALAKAGGPYVVDAGDLLTFIGGPNKPNTQYHWDFGDGVTATGAIANHTYADDGIYVAKLTTIVNQPGGVTTREFARVQVRCVKPVVNAGADITCNEGQEIEYVATFTDKEWPDKHSASFDFGDDTMPVEAAVAETNSAPLAKGSTRAKHAYCDNGVYTVTVKVVDEDGAVGVDTRRVTVLNVPPTVTSADAFAYPCTPVDLVACFTDPGWCDTHTATWDFGDCTPPQPAIVREHHDPPAGYGTVAATHVYHNCGSYHAVCTVTDDDGASGTAAIVVRVIDVVNRDFEGGFRNRLLGSVANGWEPYLAGKGAVGGTSAMGIGGPREATMFAGEEFVVHGGQRSQRVAGVGDFRAGLWQPVGANPGWDYQLTVWYHLDERGGGKCRLGVDPAGGTDPLAAAITWSVGAEHRNWAQLAVRVTTAARAITIFLEAEGEARGTAAYFDDVLLVPFPCPLKECKPPREPTEEACIDWKGQREPRELGPTYHDRGFSFRSLAGQPVRLVTWGLPPGQAKLVIPARGIEVALPFEAVKVVARVHPYTKQPLEMDARDRSSHSVGHAVSTSQQNVIETLEIVATGITSVLFMRGGNEALLIELCAYRGGPTKERPTNEHPPKEPSQKTQPPKTQPSTSRQAAPARAIAGASSVSLTRIPDRIRAEEESDG
jgi:hypothetical protein